MATEAAPSGFCAICGQPAATRCAGCADTEHTGTQGPTLYCSKACQTKGWTKHMVACKAAQDRKKLFRAAELIQETFYAVRAEVFDLNVFQVLRTSNGKLHIFDRPDSSPGYVVPARTWADGDIGVIHAVLSYSAGGCAFSNDLYELGRQAFKGTHLRLKPR
jgi:hypothetical protein